MSAPTPQQITDWLEKLGLGQYAQQFVENEITHSILPDLTDADLKELGVSALGHRRLLLRAIAELDGVEKRTPTHTAAATATVIPEQRDSAERRQVTVMFSDLVSVRQHSPPAWTRKTCARSFPLGTRLGRYCRLVVILRPQDPSRRRETYPERERGGDHEDSRISQHYEHHL